MVEVGQHTVRGAVVAVVESMKMEHEVRADCAGRIASISTRTGDDVAEGDVLATIDLDAVESLAPAPPSIDAVPASTSLRADLRELQSREALLADASRPEAIAKRHGYEQDNQ